MSRERDEMVMRATLDIVKQSCLEVAKTLEKQATEGTDEMHQSLCRTAAFAVATVGKSLFLFDLDDVETRIKEMSRSRAGEGEGGRQ